MLKISVLFLSLTFALPAVYAKEVLPRDVRTFIQTRDSCDHFRGEIPDPDERERMRDVVKEINKFCTGTDGKLASLKKKYGANTSIMSRLSTYDPKIESNRPPAR